MRLFLVNVTVNDGAVDLWGLVDSIVEKRVLRVAIENVPGVRAVNDNVIVRRAGSGTPPGDLRVLRRDDGLRCVVGLDDIPNWASQESVPSLEDDFCHANEPYEEHDFDRSRLIDFANWCASAFAYATR